MDFGIKGLHLVFNQGFFIYEYSFMTPTYKVTFLRSPLYFEKFGDDVD